MSGIPLTNFKKIAILVIIVVLMLCATIIYATKNTYNQYESFTIQNRKEDSLQQRRDKIQENIEEARKSRKYYKGF